MVRKHMKSTACLAIALMVFTTALMAREEENLVRAHWFVSGQVQGVGFRAFTFEAARELKVNGWVRNLTDGRVEIVAEAGEKTIGQLLDKVKKGPQSGRVDAVKNGKVNVTEKLGEFEIRDSATAPK
jgi:acylphosphatase